MVLLATVIIIGGWDWSYGWGVAFESTNFSRREPLGRLTTIFHANLKSVSAIYTAVGYFPLCENQICLCPILSEVQRHSLETTKGGSDKQGTPPTVAGRRRFKRRTDSGPIPAEARETIDRGLSTADTRRH